MSPKPFTAAERRRGRPPVKQLCIEESMRVIPLAIEESKLAEAERLAEKTPLLKLLPFVFTGVQLTKLDVASLRNGGLCLSCAPPCRYPIMPLCGRGRAVEGGRKPPSA
ncbi:MAG: hypothetical protein GX256_03880 [Fretibacterium sp.]|nr:hypothetical protein [Fretibacterium sp.]